MTQPTVGPRLTIHEKWAVEEDLYAQGLAPELDEDPRWITDGLDQYAPDAPVQPTLKDVEKGKRG